MSYHGVCLRSFWDSSSLYFTTQKKIDLWPEHRYSYLCRGDEVEFDKNRFTSFSWRPFEATSHLGVVSQLINYARRLSWKLIVQWKNFLGLSPHCRGGIDQIFYFWEREWFGCDLNVGQNSSGKRSCRAYISKPRWYPLSAGRCAGTEKRAVFSCSPSLAASTPSSAPSPARHCWARLQRLSIKKMAVSAFILSRL